MVKLMKVQIGKQILNSKPCLHFGSRAIGMIGKKRKLSYGFYFPNCHSLHTFFMRQAIDIIMVDHNFMIVAFYPSVKPWRFIVCKKASACFEFSTGILSDVSIGEKIKRIV